MGSGWRSHPLNTKVQDRFYTLRSPDVYVMPKGYGKRSADGHWQPLLENDLTDLSDGLGRNEVGNHGWMLSLNRPGEKVMGAPITVDGHVVFTTYLPNHSSHACVSSMGAGAVYSVNVTDASPSLDLNLDGFVETSDRSTLLNQIGVPPPPTPVIFEGENGNIHPTILIGTEQPLRGLFSRPAHKATITAEVEE